MVSEKEPKDPRSTWRKRARQVLLQEVAEGNRNYECEFKMPDNTNCGWTPKTQSRSESLDANHINKILSDIDPANLEWLCRPHHLERDRASAKGVGLHGDLDFGIDKSLYE